jgi:hypothetical protein
MEEIRLKIPDRAAELICALWGTRNTIDPYREFVKTSVIETMALRTFGMLITPIDRTYVDDTVERVGHVTYWENGMVTVSRVSGKNSALLNVVDWKDVCRSPTQDECLELWLKETGDVG